MPKKTTQAIPTTTAQRIQSARQTAGLTQQQLANAINTDVPTIQAWEQGKGCPTSRLQRIAQSCGVDITWLTNGTGTMTTSDSPLPKAVPPAPEVWSPDEDISPPDKFIFICQDSGMAPYIQLGDKVLVNRYYEGVPLTDQKVVLVQIEDKAFFYIYAYGKVPVLVKAKPSIGTDQIVMSTEPNIIGIAKEINRTIQIPQNFRLCHH